MHHKRRKPANARAGCKMCKPWKVNGYRVVGPNRELYLQSVAPGIDPEQYVTEIQFPVERVSTTFSVNQYKEKEKMQATFTTKPAFTVVGIKYHGKNQNNEIPQLWTDLGPRMASIPNPIAGAAYGVCGNMEANGEFDYVAGFEVESTADVPEGMVHWSVLEQRYAVFTCTLPTLHEALQHIYHAWLPESGYQHANGPEFELYNESFDPQDPSSEMYVYIPVK